MPGRASRIVHTGGLEASRSRWRSVARSPCLAQIPGTPCPADTRCAGISTSSMPPPLMLPQDGRAMHRELVRPSLRPHHQGAEAVTDRPEQIRTELLTARTHGHGGGDPGAGPCVVV